MSGRLAQLGEHLPYKQGVIGSSPIVPTTFLFGPVVQLVRTPPCHGGGRGFESHSGRLFVCNAAVAELADAQDLKSCGTNLPCRFDSGLRHLALRASPW